MFNNLWVERYRPQTLNELVLSDANRDILNTCTESSSIPNFLFSGKPGIGKTSLAKIIVNDILKCQYIYINASDENGIDTVRTKITNFSVTKSLDGNIKVVILDEVDGLTMDAQRALRNIMEEYTDFVRFILTANFLHRVIPPVLSRCQSMDMTPTLDSFTQRCKFVLDQEKIQYKESDLTKLKTYYPDLRKAINELQKQSSTNTLMLHDEKSNDQFASNILQLIRSGSSMKIRKSVIESEHIFAGDYISLLRSVFNIIESSDLPDMQKKECLLVTGEYIYRTAFVADQEINFYTCVLALSKIIN